MRKPLRWLIDTNVVSEMMRPAPEPRVAGFLDGIWAQGVGVASVTVWEVALITRNERDFRNTGIEVVNPWSNRRR